VSIQGGVTLACAWLFPNAALAYTTVLRLGCGRNDWVAIEAIRRGRQHGKLSIGLASATSFDGKAHVGGSDGGLEATLHFTIESMDSLPKPVSVSACVDAA